MNIIRKEMIKMDAARAKQILSSSETIQVLFQGQPVWIDALHADQFAEVSFMDSKERRQVPINKLEEA